jgi:hypothetical protein
MSDDSDEYTPTSGIVRAHYCASRSHLETAADMHQPTAAQHWRRHREFDRWLASEMAAAWDDAAASTKPAWAESPYDFVVSREVTAWTEVQS